MRLRILTLAALGTLMWQPAYAQSNAEDEAARLRAIEAQREENARIAEELRVRAAEAEEAVSTLRSTLVATADSLRDAEARATAVEDTLARLQTEEAAASASLDARRQNLSEVLAALLSLERSRPPALAVSPDDATEAAIAAIALSSVTPTLRAEAEAFQADLVRIEALRRDMRIERMALEEAETALEERRRLLADLLADREAARRQDTVRLRRLEAEDRRLAAEATSLRELIAAIEARGDEDRPPARPEPVIASALYADLPDRFSAARARLGLPAAGRVVARYGERLADGSRVDGLRVAPRPGAVVVTPFPGRIDWAEPFGRLGNVVIVDVGEGYRLVMYGLADLDVGRGDRVQAGEPLGRMPADPALLHFQIRRRDLPIDPSPWLSEAVLAAN